MSLATEGFSAMMSAFGWSTVGVLELLLVDALATRLPKFEPEIKYLMGKKKINLNQIRVRPIICPFFIINR
jgi:hypothetical protein